MCDDSAVQWSQYESHRQAVEADVRQRVCSQLLKLIDIAYDSGESQCFIQGIERAHDFIRSGASNAVDNPRDSVDNRLF